MITLKTKTINIYENLLGVIIKNGKKSVARRLLSNIFFKLNFFFEKPVYYLLLKFLKILNIFVETKVVKIKRSRYVVPFSITLNRRIYLITKWLLFVVRNNKERISFVEKFTGSLSNFFKVKIRSI
jgi:ribosomal protein S7